jgi:hypothetical protein
VVVLVRRLLRPHRYQVAVPPSAAAIVAPAASCFTFKQFMASWRDTCLVTIAVQLPTDPKLAG